MKMNPASLMRAELVGVSHFPKHLLSSRPTEDVDDEPVETLCGDVVPRKWITLSPHRMRWDETLVRCEDCMARRALR
jgi:hypothetical protein